MSNLEQGIQAVKTGDKQAAIRFLALAIQQEPNNAPAWLWLSQCLDDPAKKKDCLHRVLKFSPGNQEALRDLALLEKARLNEEQVRNPDPTLATSQPASSLAPTQPRKSPPQETPIVAEPGAGIEDKPVELPPTQPAMPKAHPAAPGPEKQGVPSNQHSLSTDSQNKQTDGISPNNDNKPATITFPKYGYGRGYIEIIMDGTKIGKLLHQDE
jgi:hypothetical protein